MPRHQVVEEEEEQPREGESRAHTWGRWQQSRPWRPRWHTPGERRRQDKPSQDTIEPQHPTHQGGAHGGATVPGMPTSDGSSRIRAARDTERLGANRDGGESHIDADHEVRRRTAVRLRPISSLEMAGSGRNKAATATTVEERAGALGLGEEERRERLGRLDRAQWAGPI
jgi:hypothetical protein